ncbi:uncharacterized protein LOC135087874 isoform X2 [Ostrinia nubilalis]|uniref:uncharacterized protein LOC135087874 isoform X2 n=1 Tax=Ostrinia nubilalis TaxID=29057 RepID=UPI0030823017
MSNNNVNKNYKRPKQKTQSTTNPDRPKQTNRTLEKDKAEPLCPLAAKDSEWVDILQSPGSDPAKSSTNVSDEEEVDCEDGPQMKPLAIMFPGLLEKDPNTLQGMLNKAMSTTEVTKHLVDLGQKANFTFMKKADRLIPPDKVWLESLTENSNSFTSMTSALFSGSLSSDYDADNEVVICNHSRIKRNEKQNSTTNIQRTNISSDDILTVIKQIVAEIIQGEDF